MRHTPSGLVVGLAFLWASCSGSGDGSAPAPAATTSITASATTTEAADILPAAYTASAPASILTDVAYGDDPAHKLDHYLPDEDFAPVILFVHGGGWGPGGREPVPEMVLRFVERGFAVASMEYRGAPDHRFPAAVQDVKRAIRWLKQESPAAGRVDGEQIVLFGGSSGGQLAALVAATPGHFEPDGTGTAALAVDSTVVALVSLAGPADFRTMFPDPHPWVAEAVESWLGCGPCSDERLAEASPIVPSSQGMAIAERWGESAGPATRRDRPGPADRYVR